MGEKISAEGGKKLGGAADRKWWRRDGWNVVPRKWAAKRSWMAFDISDICADGSKHTHTQPEPELVSQSAVRIYIISYNMPSQLGDWPSLLFPWVLLYISTPYSRLYPAIRLQLPPAASLHCSHPHFRSTSAILMMARRPDPPPLPPTPTHPSMRIISFSRCL
jgi:hypothetical protein